MRESRVGKPTGCSGCVWTGKAVLTQEVGTIVNVRIVISRSLRLTKSLGIQPSKQPDPANGEGESEYRQKEQQVNLRRETKRSASTTMFKNRPKAVTAAGIARYANG